MPHTSRVWKEGSVACPELLSKDPRFPVANLASFIPLATGIKEGRNGAQEDCFRKQGPCRPIVHFLLSLSQTFVIQEP